ncbi:MAG TPA: tripartite tricarboxylate transporter substrate-binding protein [Ramlibacter sp.]|nr:tripartite tricarboxylate transporter substrate-binding protein [Ramlibacter sp.]
MMNKRAFLKTIAAVPAASFCSLPLVAQAQSYPSRPITLVAPYGPGNTADVLGRLVAQQLGALLGQPVVVENRPGAGGVGAIKQVAAAAPDGHTLLLVGAAAAISQSLFKPAPYDMLKSFVPVSTLASTDVLILVGKDSKLQKLGDFVREARQKKGSMMVGVSLLGTTQHLSAELFKLNSKLGYTLVPYKTASALSAALLAGEIDAGFELITPMMGLLQGGQARALAIGSAKRSELLPQVPTVAELGIPAFDVTAWGMVVAPARTPDAIVQRLNREIQRVLAQPEVAQRFKDVGQRVFSGSPAQARDFLASEITKWDAVITEAKVTLQ